MNDERPYYDYYNFVVNGSQVPHTYRHYDMLKAEYNNTVIRVQNTDSLSFIHSL